MAGQAFAYRPFDGTDAAVAAGGELELELGPVGLLDSRTDRELIVPAGIINLGVYRNTELVLEGKEHYRLTERMLDATGSRAGGAFAVTDTAFSVKHVFKQGFLQGRAGTSVASEVSICSPRTTISTASERRPPRSSLAERVRWPCT